VDVLALFGVRDSLVVYPAGQRADTPQHCSANTPPATERNSSAHITHTHTRSQDLSHTNTQAGKAR